MTRLRFRPFATLFALLPALVSVQGCQDRNSSENVENVSVSMKNTETYKYPTVSGDEQGARISTQAKHYSISEIRRNAETAFVAV